MSSTEKFLLCLFILLSQIEMGEPKAKFVMALIVGTTGVIFANWTKTKEQP